ncbi:extracellular solute-binding protein [bacterium]|nr:extracellular solute-binding protein [bacterium]
MFKRSRINFFTLLLLTVFVLTSGFGCKWNPFQTEKELFQPITLEYWGVWDTPQQMSELIKAYRSSHPTISVNYRNFRYDEYERKLLEAWADDRGPDIFAIPATWLKNYQHFLEPMPPSVRIPVYEMQGSIKKEVVTVLRDFRGLSTFELKDRYVPVVYDDVVMDDKIYGLPYSIDTLVTFYNIDLLNQAGIPEPMEDFFELVDQTPKLTKVTQDNRILQSAVALGGTDNIPRFFDVFSSIMIQNGVNVHGSWFDPISNNDSATRLEQVLGFYTDFARPNKASYSWNKDMPNAFDLFVDGRLAYFFGYSYHADQLRDSGLQFDWGIKPFPQTRGAEGTKYFTNYWVNVVPKKSKNKNAAWNFVQSTASEDLVKVYLGENKRPTALRSLINGQLADYDISTFASQVLTADNWYEGYNINLAEKYVADILDDLVSGELVIDQGRATLQLFVNRINQTYQKTE